MEDAITAITAISTLRHANHPLRTHNLQIEDAPNHSILDVADFADYKREHDGVEAGLPIGDPDKDLVEAKDGSYVGRGPEPSSKAIISGFAATDFEKGEKVLAWWWGNGG